MKYVDPDGNETFNYNNYMSGRLYGEALGVAAEIQNFFGKVGNFVSNIFTGNNSVQSYYGVSISLGDFEYSGTMYVDSKSNINFEFSNPTEELTNALQSSLGLPVQISSEGMNADIPLGDYYAVGVSVPVSCSSDGNKASLSLGLKGSVNCPLIKSLKGSASTGYKITASVQDGPNGTIQNGKNESLNQKVDAYNYFSSNDFIMENVE